MLSLLVLFLVVYKANPVKSAGVACDDQALGQIPTLKGSWVSLTPLYLSTCAEIACVTCRALGPEK